MIRLICAIALLSAAIRPVRADEARPSADFDQGGVIVEVDSFFKEAGVTPRPAAQTGTANLALATDTGLYSFLETPENETRTVARDEQLFVHPQKGLLLAPGLTAGNVRRFEQTMAILQNTQPRFRMK